VPAQQNIEYGLIGRDDIDCAARIYIDSFPDRVKQCFSQGLQAETFYQDLMELMRRLHHETFFAAHVNGELVGYLILTTPCRGMLRALLDGRLVGRVLLHTITGQYGFSRSLFQRILQSTFNTTSAPSKALTSPVPHIYTVVVDGRWTGRRVGSTLIHLAKNAVLESYSQISLHVDVNNNDAIRLYKRIGFRIVGDNGDQCLMIWDLRTPQARESHNEPSGCFRRD
jgi:ribosomal protein S18 acetylase RimI-like enzyme